MKTRVIRVVAVCCAALVWGDRWPAAGPAVAQSESNAAAAATAAQLWTCGMHRQVIQDKPGLCPICGMTLTPLREEGSAAKPAARAIRYWWDSMMNPPYISERPGKSPMGMDLVPVYEDEVRAGPGVSIDPTIEQSMGIRVATVTEGSLRKTVRAVGYLAEAEPNRHDINLRVSGWIEHLYADTDGMHLPQGAPLFDLYSPELQVAIGELITARKARDTAPGSAKAATAQLYAAAEEKLRLLGLAAAQVRELAQADQVPRTVRFRSPIMGHLVEKPVVVGSAVKAGERVMRIVDHGELWLDAQVYEQDLPFVRWGQDATATVQGQSDQVHGRISFIHPHVDPMTRTTMVRIPVANPSLQLRPGMYATVEFDDELTPNTVLVPREAVIDTGTRQLAFVALGEGHFEPRQLQIGAVGAGGVVQVLAGLAPGERVVTSGQFLLDAESRLREGIEKLLAAKQPARAGDSADQEPTHDQHHH